MTLSRARLSPGAGHGREGVRVAALLALTLAVVGAVGAIWRPLAPAIGQVVTDLDRFSPEVLRVIGEYRRPRYAAGLGSLALSLAVPLWFVWTARGRAFVRRLAGHREHAPFRAGLVAAVLTIVGRLVTLPISVWIGYVHEGRWGFRVSGPGLWARDQAVGALVAALVVAVVVTVLMWAVARWPRSWAWRMVTIGTALAAVLVLLQPLVIEPLFSQTRPLEPGPIRDAVTDVLVASGEGELPIEVSDASRRTTRVNAYVSGLGPTRNVVLYDTILELPPDQVAVVVAHELAHREHRDLPRGVLLSATALIIPLLVLRRVLRSQTTAATTGARGPSDPRMVAVVLAVGALATVVGQPVGALVSRRAEAAADHRALELTGASEELIRTARTFALADLSQPSPPSWVVFLWATHPTVDERIRAAAAFAQQEGDALPTLDDLAEDEAAIRHPALGPAADSPDEVS